MYLNCLNSFYRMKNRKTLTLGIETSCDETSAAVVENADVVLSNIVASSLKFHQKYNGIIPEIASRAHIESISLVCRQALDKAAAKIQDVDCICLTKGPGLIGSLLVGVTFAKGLSLAHNKPLIGVNHLEAHLYANFLSQGNRTSSRAYIKPRPPFIGLVVSGGHTNLFYAERDFSFKILSSTLDDAAGEAFDKVSRILKLGYPGGPYIERLARKGDPRTLKFNCQGSKGLDFSFSGIKTSVLLEAKKSGGSIKAKRNIAACFQKAVVDTLIEKSLRACMRNKLYTLVVGGGVAVNRYFQGRLYQEARLKGVKVFFPDKGLCMDNAAMIAGLGSRLFRRGIFSNYYLSPS